ncbi:hypothetical protein CW357_11585 [Rummeliibacillus sp. TYF005]|uniref:hypothetical protein n=1 Tax=Rummeliibacillus sp. TYF005 TaxID=2058214 RepID=UPI000F5405E3|nr:hypothetical protein [Rummeliibacillus sp. TYF005]RPJ95246.1 hypothetical protein CW357_11585 [Rummeliibacillus sp. TYF005]
MKKRIFICILLLLLTVCSKEKHNETNKNNTNANNANPKVEKLNINISEYFPPLITRNQYNSFDMDGSKITIISVAKYLVGNKNKNTRILEETTYSNGKSSSTINYYDVTENQISNDVEVELKNQSFWEDHETTYEIKDTNKTVYTKAGKFNDCIVVKKIDKSSGLLAYIYYAPKIGIIKMTTKSSKYGENIMELVSTKYSPYNEPTEKDESRKEEDSISMERDGNNAPTSIGNAKSGKLPNKTNKSSTLNANDYAKKASEASMKSFEQYIFNRPDSFEEEGTDQIWHFNHGISLKVNDEVKLKEVYFDYENGPNEEAFLIARALIIGLDPNIEDSVNESILFTGKEKATFEVGEFKVGFEFDERTFKLLAIVK